MKLAPKVEGVDGGRVRMVDTLRVGDLQKVKFRAKALHVPQQRQNSVS